MPVCVLKGPLLALDQYLLIVLVLVKVLLVVNVGTAEKLVGDISVVFDGRLFLVRISIVVVKTAARSSSCVSHYGLQIDFDRTIFLIILCLRLLRRQLLGVSLVVGELVDDGLGLGDVIRVKPFMHSGMLACASFGIVLVLWRLDLLTAWSIWVSI